MKRLMIIFLGAAVILNCAPEVFAQQTNTVRSGTSLSYSSQPYVAQSDKTTVNYSNYKQLNVSPVKPAAQAYQVQVSEEVKAYVEAGKVLNAGGDINAEAVTPGYARGASTSTPPQPPPSNVRGPSPCAPPSSPPDTP